MTYALLYSTDIDLECRKHWDEYFSRSSVIATNRSHKRNQAEQVPMADPSGAEHCLLCNPESLDGSPTIDFHLEGKVLSFPNAAPFFESGHRVFALWNDDPTLRFNCAHHYRLDQVDEADIFFPITAEMQVAHDFPSTHAGHHILGGRYPYAPTYAASY